MKEFFQTNSIKFLFKKINKQSKKPLKKYLSLWHYGKFFSKELHLNIILETLRRPWQFSR